MTETRDTGPVLQDQQAATPQDGAPEPSHGTGDALASEHGGDFDPAAPPGADPPEPGHAGADQPGASTASSPQHPPMEGANLDLMLDLPLEVTVELGRTTMQLGEALALQSGAIVELNRLPGEPLDMHVNDRLVARGEVVVINDALALRITEIIGSGSARG